MPLTSGAKLGPYEILSPIGAGGMGEVYKARDTRLDRIVAIKVSAAQFSERFEREARAVAALNHPHICTLYDVGPDYLVMEYIQGKPLAGPLPLDDALRYAIQIAEALVAAHRQGIVHRDLKPANILVAKTGVKLLDFGLAKRSPKREAAASDETVTQALTQNSAIMGTLQYMAPEQLQGKEADPRSDIFSFGCVLYEILTGRRAFDGASAANVITNVMSTEPPPVEPPPLDHLIRTCLAKDPEERRQSIHDVLLELRWFLQASPATDAPRRRRAPIAAIAGGVCFLAAAGLGWIHFREPAPPAARIVRFTISPPENAPYADARLGTAQISPDGTRLFFLEGLGVSGGAARLWMRPLDSTAAKPLPETEGAKYPFWSDDSRYIAFFADGKLKRFPSTAARRRSSVARRMGAAERGRPASSSSRPTIMADSIAWMPPEARPCRPPPWTQPHSATHTGRRISFPMGATFCTSPTMANSIRAPS
jgi:serine/threonine protein kinase